MRLLASTVFSPSKKQPQICLNEGEHHSQRCCCCYPSVKMSVNSDQDHHPVKPGRRGSIASTTVEIINKIK